MLNVSLIFLVVCVSLTSSSIDWSKLENDDKYRYKKTYCALVKKEAFAREHNLVNMCTANTKFFKPNICVEDPTDSDDYVPNTCLPLQKIHDAAEKFCPKTTTTPKPTTTTTEPDDYFYEDPVTTTRPPEIDSSLIQEDESTAEDKSDDTDDSETTSIEAPPDVDVVQVLELDEPVLESGIVEDERYFELNAKSFSFCETFAQFQKRKEIEIQVKGLVFSN